MGLAAAQARLLTITARKSDCEFQSMSLSHQKIALSRDMENVSTEYQNALNQTKLVYDYYGSGTSEMDLTYGLLMTPLVYNDYYPKLVTDSQNRVVLNSSYAAAAKAAGIPAEGLSGTPSSAVRNAFIEALCGESIITPATAAAVESVTYGNTIGLGSTTNVTSATTECTYEELINKLKATESTTAYGLDIGGDSNKIEMKDANDKSSSKCEGVYKNGELISGNDKISSSASFTLADLLTDNYDLGWEAVRGEQTPVIETAKLQEQIVDEILPWISDQFSSILGGVTENDLAIQYAYNQVYDLLYPNDDLQVISANLNGGERLDNNTLPDATVEGISVKNAMATAGTCVREGRNKDHWYSDVGVEAKNNIGFVYSVDKHDHGWHKDYNDHSYVAISLSNIAQVFLTAMVEYLQGENGDVSSKYYYDKGDMNNSSLYNPENDKDVTFNVVSSTDATTGTESSVSNFYDAMFNLICVNGWVENDQVDDADYLQEMMKSGFMYISSIADDGYYYQGNYSTDVYISEVSDDEAIARAEAKYNTEKTKIENKEDTIDLKMKNLDTEISSLTTEYDTTKSIISKSIEKSFKRYDA